MTTGGKSIWKTGALPVIEPEDLRGILAAASDLTLEVDASGLILSAVVSPVSESFGNLTHWEGRPVVEFLSDDSMAKFAKAHKASLAGDMPTRQVELNHVDNASWQFPVRYTFHKFGDSDRVLMLGRDLRPIAETQQQLVQAQIALEQGYEARREYDNRYRVMLSHTNEAVLFVNVQDGRVSDCSDRAAELLGMKRDVISGSSLASHLSNRKSAELVESLMNASLAESGGQIQVTAEKSGEKIVIRPTVFRTGGHRILYCAVDTLDAPDQRTDTETSRSVALFRTASDAILFADKAGKILSANDSFLDLVGAAHGGDVRGRSLADFLVRGMIDLGVLTDNSERTGHMRIYATKLLSELGSRLSVEISATRIRDAAEPLLAFIIRDVSRVEGVRGSSASKMSGDSDRNVMELVGSASLKEIVAETTDVVEKMCIETAVNLTKNNRVAAAEMLGLSRQSLYVKLRKYGLLNKNS